MGNQLKKGLQWLSDQQRKHNSEDVVYLQRSTGDQIPCKGMLGNKLLRQDDGAGGFIITVTDLDFLISAEDLPGVEPQRGDQVFIVMGGSVHTFEVTPYGADPPWRWSDPHESMLRVHTKYVEKTPVP